MGFVYYDNFSAFQVWCIIDIFPICIFGKKFLVPLLGKRHLSVSFSIILLVFLFFFSYNLPTNNIYKIYI